MVVGDVAGAAACQDTPFTDPSALKDSETHTQGKAVAIDDMRPHTCPKHTVAARRRVHRRALAWVDPAGGAAKAAAARRIVDEAVLLQALEHFYSRVGHCRRVLPPALPWTAAGQIRQE